MSSSYDVITVGSGPAGYTAAIRASQSGFKVAIVEKDDSFGGVCLNRGCIPTKFLLDCSAEYYAAKNGKILGVKPECVELNLSSMVSGAASCSSKLADGVSYLIKKNNIAVYKGQAKIGKSTVHISDGEKVTEINSSRIILATGAKLRNLKKILRDGKRIWNAYDALKVHHLPKSICIIGSGAIGIEFACFFSDLGSKVTVMEVQDRILLSEDEEISGAVAQILKASGIIIKTSVSVENCSYITDSELSIEYVEKGETLRSTFDTVLLAAGVEGNSSNLGLENTKVVVGNGGFICVDSNFETAEKGIFAIGDVIGAPCLAHKASHDAIACINAFICKYSSVHSPVPSCIFSHPYQVASIGLTEKAALAKGYLVKIGRFGAVGNGRSVIKGYTEGFVKVVSDSETGELLGIHMLGIGVTEIVSAFSVGMAAEATVEVLESVIFPHPTVSESVHEAILALGSGSING